ncbi:hypothetical protein [Clostridium paraputrificum]|uniref:hypothetical protein n=1 Tax=Clostridium paraputrificum TaxID=29363 RepID=UPI002FCDADC2
MRSNKIMRILKTNVLNKDQLDIINKYDKEIKKIDIYILISTMLSLLLINSKLGILCWLIAVVFLINRLMKRIILYKNLKRMMESE